LLGKKLHPERNLDQAFVIFIEKDLKKLLSENDQLFNEKRKINDILFNLKKSEINDIIKDVNPLIEPHYSKYCNKQGLLNFETFFNFYKDFTIFPEMINLILVKNLFFSLADAYGKQLNMLGVNPLTKTSEKNAVIKSMNSVDISQNNVNRRAITKNEFIDYGLFLDSLGITSFLMKSNSNTNQQEKFLYLIERISHSEAAKSLTLKSGKNFYTSKDYINCATMLRIKYGDFYNKKEMIEEEKKEENFEDIFD